MVNSVFIARNVTCSEAVAQMEMFEYLIYPQLTKISIVNFKYMNFSLYLFDDMFIIMKCSIP